MAKFFLFALLVLLCVSCGGESSEDAAESGLTPAPAPPPMPAIPPAADPGSGYRRLGTATMVPVPEGMDVANEYTRMFYVGELETLHAKFSDEMKTVLSLDDLAERRAQFSAQFGAESEVIHQESKVDGDFRAYVRWVRYENYPDIVGIEWILRKDDSVAGFYVRPAAPGDAQPSAQ